MGPYVVEEFISQNTKSYIPNPNYFGANDVSRFDRFTVTMISDGTVTFQLYQNRELDEMDVGESTLTTIQADPNSEYNQQLCEKRPKKFSYQMHFNYQKNNEDGTPDDNWNKAIANTAFRQCFYKGLEMTNWYARTNKINPLKCENDYYTMPGVCYNTQGQEYSTLVAKEMGFDKEAYDGKTMIRLRANNGDIADLKKQAMDELSAIGVTFPVHAAYYIIAANSTALDNATVLKQCFTDSFGDDFIVLDVNTFVSSTMKEVVAPKLQSFTHMGWGADFGDPINFLTQIIIHDENAYYSCNMTNIAGIVNNGPASYQTELVAAYEKFTDLVNEARAIVDDTDARYTAFAKAEAYFLDENLIFPTVYDITWCLTHVNEYQQDQRNVWSLQLQGCELGDQRGGLHHRTVRLRLLPHLTQPLRLIQWTNNQSQKAEPDVFEASGSFLLPDSTKPRRAGKLPARRGHCVKIQESGSAYSWLSYSLR